MSSFRHSYKLDLLDIISVKNQTIMGDSSDHNRWPEGCLIETVSVAIIEVYSDGDSN